MEKALEQLLASRKVPQSLLLSGKNSDYIQEQALAFAKQWLGIDAIPHPDLLVIQPVGKTAQYSIESLRAFKEEVFKSPYILDRKLFILCEAERMPPVSANALLKVFEEPLETSYIFLCSSAPSQLLPTVRSRCQEIKLSGAAKKSELPPALFEFFAAGESYSQLRLLDLCDTLASWIEQAASDQAPETIETDAMSPHQKEAAEKRQEGDYALKVASLTQEVLLAKMYWVRDMHLLLSGADPDLLHFKEHHEALMITLAKGAPLPLESLEGPFLQARMSLERFTPLPTLLLHYLRPSRI